MKASACFLGNKAGARPRIRVLLGVFARRNCAGGPRRGRGRLGLRIGRRSGNRSYLRQGSLGILLGENDDDIQLKRIAIWLIGIRLGCALA